MSEQDFRERVLSAIEGLKRTTERIEDKMERVEDRIERVEIRIDQVNERVDNRLASMEKDANDRLASMEKNVNDRLASMEKNVSNVHGDVRWIRGKLEGRQEATSNQDVKTAIWIALGSALAAIVSLIKSFWN